MDDKIWINKTLSFKLKIDETSPKNDKCGYFSFLVGDQEFGDFTVYTYLEMIIAEFEKILKYRDSLYQIVFDGKTNDEIFNLIYKFTVDWDYFESISSEQAQINNLFFLNNIWQPEESMDRVELYIVFRNDHFHFLFKHSDKHINMYNQKLYECEVNQEDLTKTLDRLYKLIPRDRQYLDIFKNQKIKN